MVPQNPVFEGPTSSSISATQSSSPFSGVSLYPDSPSSAFTITVTPTSLNFGTLSVPQNLASSLTSVTYDYYTGAATLVVPLSGYPGYTTAVNSALKWLSFSPNMSGVPAGQPLVATFTIKVSLMARGFILGLNQSFEIEREATEPFTIYAYLGASILAGPGAALTIATPGDDTIATSAARSFVYGNGGLDSVNLGAGSETVYLNNAGQYGAWKDGQGIDIISGFQSGVDRLAVDMNALGVSPGHFQFVSGAQPVATSAEATFLYDASTGYLWFDADGAGGASADLIAFLPGASALSASDLIVAQVSFAEGGNVYNTTSESTAYGLGPDQTMWATGDHQTLIGGPYRETFIAQGGFDSVFAGDGGSFIAGLGGNDYLHGGAGADAYYFSSRTAGADTIFDFSAAQGDHIFIKGSAFAARPGFQFTDGIGFIQAVNPQAVIATATFLYDTPTGYLWYDPDGTGATSRTLVAYLPGTPGLHASDFTVT